jgi:hypothetical protein
VRAPPPTRLRRPRAPQRAAQARFHTMSAAQKRPPPDGAGGSAPPAPKRPAGAAAPAFLEDDDYGEDEDVFLYEALDAQMAGSVGGARAHWCRPALPPLDPASCSIGARRRARCGACLPSRGVPRQAHPDARPARLRHLRRVSADGH